MGRPIGPEMLGNVPGRTTGGCEIRQIPDLEILCKADTAVGMKAVTRHGRVIQVQVCRRGGIPIQKQGPRPND
jgi:hypothetical protein